MRRTTAALTAAAAILLAACGGNKPAEQPAPQPAQPAFNADSARAAQEAAARKAQEEAAARAREQAQADSAAAAQRAAAATAEVSSALATMIHFDFNKSDIKSDDQTVLDYKAKILAANPALTIRINGFADERGSDEYNMALGMRRATSAKRYLVNKGVADSRIEVFSYGEDKPVDPGHNEDAWAKNRRDEFQILAGGTTLVAPGQ
ncbi:MAG TPA: peptidoglycan-associated lipoprotein Pal [Gemmatimonadales bacterium]|jgi:peptidoglycan-associated lipoprotein|nr:peptidoglycan-associated lipoprotein Pal [Gemmatimonadales bacterium]